MIIARIESLILEKGQEDALRRADAYVAAGADGRCTWVGSPLRIDRHPGPPPSGSAGGDRAAEDGAEGGSDHVVTATVA